MVKTRKRSTGTTRTEARSGARGLSAGRDINADSINTGTIIGNAFVVQPGTVLELRAKLESPAAAEPADRLTELSRLVRQAKITPEQLDQLYWECLPPQAT